MMTILIVGAFTIAYTATGGMKAVMLTDLIQGIIVIVGIGAIFYKLLSLFGFNAAEVYQYAAQHGRGYEAVASPKFYRLDLQDRFCFWILLLSAIMKPMLSLSADQSVIQRLLAARGYHDARKSVIVHALMTLPIGAMLWFIGIALFGYYNRQPGLLPEGVTSDYVLGYFINTQLQSSSRGRCRTRPGLIISCD